jgi:O-antigen/teichoic acid export membrane protein
VFKLSNLSGLQLFQLLRFSASVVIGIVFAQINLPKTAIGQYETFIMLAGLVSFFWISGIINAMLALYPKKNGEEKRELIFNSFVSLVLCACLSAVILFVFSQNILSFLKREDGSQILKLSIVYMLLNSPSFLTEYIFFLHEQKKAMIIYGVVTACSMMLFVLLPVIFHYPIIYALFGLITLAVLKLFFCLLLLTRYSSFRWNWGLQLQAFRLSTPIFLSLFVSGSAEYTDGMIIKAKFDNWAFAIYRYGARELPVLFILANTLSSAMIPAIAANLQEGLLELKQKSTRLMHLFFPLTIFLMLGSYFIYKYVFTESFVYSAVIFNIYLLLIIPRVLFPQTILTGLQQSSFLLLSAIIELGINISCSIYLAGKMGLPGVAVGTFIAYSFDKLFLMAVNYFSFHIGPSKYVNLTAYFVYVILTLVAFVFSFFIMKIA